MAFVKAVYFTRLTDFEISKFNLNILTSLRAIPTQKLPPFLKKMIAKMI